MCAMTDWSFFLFATFSSLQCRPLLSRLALAARSERHAAEQVTFLLEGGEKNSLPQITHVFLFFPILSIPLLFAIYLGKPVLDAFIFSKGRIMGNVAFAALVLNIVPTLFRGFRLFLRIELCGFQFL